MLARRHEIEQRLALLSRVLGAPRQIDRGERA